MQKRGHQGLGIFCLNDYWKSIWTHNGDPESTLLFVKIFVVWMINWVWILLLVAIVIFWVKTGQVSNWFVLFYLWPWIMALTCLSSQSLHMYQHKIKNIYVATLKWKFFRYLMILSWPTCLLPNYISLCSCFIKKSCSFSLSVWFQCSPPVFTPP